MSPVLTHWLCLSVVLTTATQLRAESMPIGPGEDLLVIWLIVAGVLVLFSRGQMLEESYSTRALILFWLGAFVLLSAGAVLALIKSRSPGTAAAHDAVALALSALLSIVVTLVLRLPGQVLPASRSLVVITTIAAIGLLLTALLTRSIGPVQLWYAEIRFTGWAANPNQFALLVLMCPFLALQLAADSPRRIGRTVWTGMAVAVVIAGLATASDALVLAWATCGLGIVFTFWFMQVAGSRASLLSFTIVGVITPLLLIAFLLPFLKPLGELSFEVVSGVYDLGGQGATRFTIWQHGLEAALASPWIGFGPGPHSGFNAPHEAVEAHNTFIDWSASTGLLGLVALVALLAYVWKRTMQCGKRFLALGVVAAVVFAAFHFVLRQPIFWLYLILFMECSRAGPAARRILSNEP